MQIHDPKSDQQLSLVGLRLTKTEARELRDALDDLLASKSDGWHTHVSSADYQTEISVWIDDDPKEVA